MTTPVTEQNKIYLLQEQEREQKMKEREIAEKMITDGKATIVEAEERLAELDKPKLRHGSKLCLHYGKNADTGNRIALYDSGGALRAFDIFDGKFGCDAEDKMYTVLDEPTIFDDLKALAEPLEKAIVTLQDHEVCMDLYKDGHIWLHFIEAEYGGAYVPIKEVIDFHQKLGRVIATAKKKKGE